MILLSSLLGLRERLSREMTEMRPFQTNHSIIMAHITELDAWNGARVFADSPNIGNYLISRNEYNEYGGEYLKEHDASNRFFRTPPIITTEVVPTKSEQLLT